MVAPWRVLPIDTRAALHFTRLSVPDPLARWDALIAAIAHVHSLTLVTRNTRVFEGAECGS